MGNVIEHKSKYTKGTFSRIKKYTSRGKLLEWDENLQINFIICMQPDMQNCHFIWTCQSHQMKQAQNTHPEIKARS